MKEQIPVKTASKEDDLIDYSAFVAVGHYGEVGLTIDYLTDGRQMTENRGQRIDFRLPTSDL